MPDRVTIERQIRETLDNEKQALALSQKLFAPEGLFQQLGTTEEERREIIQSEIYREAQKRLTELQQQEAAEFSRAADGAQSFLAGTGSIRAGIKT